MYRMSVRRCLPWIALLALTPAWCQLSLAEVIAGKTIPLALPLQQLDADWREMRIEVMADPLPPGAFGNDFARQDALTVFTKGQTLTCGAETFIIAYVQQETPAESAAPALTPFAAPAIPPAMTKESPVHLALINLRKVGHLTHVQPFNLEATIAASNAEREGLLREQVAAHVQQLTESVLMWAEAHDGVIPPKLQDAASLRALFTQLDPQVFSSPLTGQAYLPNASLAGRRAGDIRNPEQIVLIYEAVPAQDGTRAACYLDQHTERLTSQQWEQARLASGIK